MSLSHPPRWALPTFTALIGSGGFIFGIYSFLSPIQAARVYGVDLPVPRHAGLDTKGADTQVATPAQSQPDGISRHVAYIYAHGIRNFSTGLSILGLTAFWQFSSLCRTSEVASSAVQKALGIVILAGALTPMADAPITWQAAQNSAESDVRWNAPRAHASRSFVWLLGGLWCLLT